jgi:putative membrane protein
VYGACQHEIEIAKFAESKAQSDEVREFAQQMVREHTPGCQAMQQKAGQLAADTPAQQQQGGGLNWISIHKEIGQQCLANLKQELSEKQGIEFDKCFMGEQIGEHMKVIASLKVLRNHASSELRQDLDKELQMAQTHLQHAKQIVKQLDEKPSERVSRRAADSSK